MSPASMGRDSGLIEGRLSTAAASRRPAALRLRRLRATDELDADDRIRRLRERDVGAQEGQRRGLVEPEILVRGLDEELGDEDKRDLEVDDDTIRADRAATRGRRVHMIMASRDSKQAGI